MNRDAVIATLRAHESELRAVGVAGVAVFGSVGRDQAAEGSDVDLVVRLNDAASRGGFTYYGRLEALRQHLAAVLGQPVDVVAEPVHDPGLRQGIARDQAIAF